MLSQEQRSFFTTFGFLHIRHMLSANEADTILAVAEDIWLADIGERPFDGTERQQVNGFVEQRDELMQLIEDDRIYLPIQDLLGSGFVWIGSDGNRYAGDTGWHPDGSNHQYLRVKVALYLDSLTRETGALRVIPGSHHKDFHQYLGLLTQREDSTITPYGVRASKRTNPEQSGFGIASSEIPSFAINSQPGDIIFFDQNIWHASFKGGSGRRMFTLCFGEQPKTEADLNFLRRMYSGQLEHVKNRQFTKHEFLYGEEFLSGRKGERIRLVTGLIRELGFK